MDEERIELGGKICLKGIKFGKELKSFRISWRKIS